MRYRIILAAAAAALCTGSAWADDLAITIYNQNFALVKDVRTMELERGTFTASIDDVAASIDATSVHIKALDHPGDVGVLEQNFKYDLASADRLMNRYLNSEIDLVLEDGSTASGVLLSYQGGALVLSRDDGAAIISRDQVRDIQLGTVPGGLVVKPTLEWLLSSRRTGSEPMEVSYLTDNINWHAEYVAVVNEDDTGLDLSGWVSINNTSGATYRNAKLKLVAGDVHRVTDPRLPMPKVQRLEMEAVLDMGQFQSQELFEYHVYSLSRPATLADRETKQLTLFPTAEARAEKVLTYDGARDPKNVRVTMEFMNSESNGMGMPIPKGKVRVFKQDRDGAMEFVGEDRVDHTPRDERIRVYLGNSFDVKGERTRTNTQKISSHVQEDTYAVEVRNHKRESARVVVVEHLSGRSWTIRSETHAHTKKDSHTIEYVLDLEPGEAETVTYTVRTEW